MFPDFTSNFSWGVTVPIPTFPEESIVNLSFAPSVWSLRSPVFDLTKPDGSLRKFIDSKKIKSLGFKHEIDLKNGLRKTYQNYIKA